MLFDLATSKIKIGHGVRLLPFPYNHPIRAAEMGATMDLVCDGRLEFGTGRSISRDEVERIVHAANPDADFSVVSNPEFLREGAAIRDFKHPDRIVVGSEDERARETMAALYRPLYLNAAPIMYTGRRTAELIKYAANAFLATKPARKKKPAN